MNVTAHIAKHRHDETYTPKPREGFAACDHIPGSSGKIESLRLRAEKGFPLWHPGDAKGHLHTIGRPRGTNHGK